MAYAIAVIILGLLVGSFLNVCIYRIPKGKSIVSPPSACPGCGKRLGPFELVPVLSYLFLNGRCRVCGAKISLRYPAVEMLTAFLFCLCFWRFGLGAELILSLIFTSLLLTTVFIDFDTMELPDGISLTCAAAGLVYGITVKNSLLFPLLGAAAGFLLTYIIYKAGSAVYKKEAMGGGDIKLAAATGTFLGWQGLLLSVYLAFFIAFIILLPALLTGFKKRHDLVPFGPALAAGALITLLWGSSIWNWYAGVL
ncbi:MAG: prepilin peptidase [Candidatus Margulisiibacteriota bacterium]